MKQETTFLLHHHTEVPALLREALLKDLAWRSELTLCADWRISEKEEKNTRACRILRIPANFVPTADGNKVPKPASGLLQRRELGRPLLATLQAMTSLSRKR